MSSSSVEERQAEEAILRGETHRERFEKFESWKYATLRDAVM
jgi:hypothetical protein